VADAGAGEERGGGSAGGTDPDDGGVCRSETLLAGCADSGEENLAGVAFVIGYRVGARAGRLVGGIKRHKGKYKCVKGHSSGERTRWAVFASVR
jgi:hypothetical protein